MASFDQRRQSPGIARTLLGDHAHLGQVASKRVEQLGALPDQQLARPVVLMRLAFLGWIFDDHTVELG